MKAEGGRWMTIEIQGPLGCWNFTKMVRATFRSGFTLHYTTVPSLINYCTRTAIYFKFPLVSIFDLAFDSLLSELSCLLSRLLHGSLALCARSCSYLYTHYI